MLVVRVQIVGEEFLQTERKTVINLANRPETEVLGYVKYYLETVFYHREGSWKYGAQWVIFGKFQGVWKCGKTLSQLFCIFPQSKIK